MLKNQRFTKKLNHCTLKFNNSSCIINALTNPTYNNFNTNRMRSTNRIIELTLIAC